MIKKKKENNFNIVNVVTLIVSIVAIVISYFSFQISKDALEYESNRDSFQNTPALTESIDSSFISFGLNSDSELQFLNIVFPKKLNQTEIVINTKPIRIPKRLLNDISESYLQEKIKQKDSMVYIGTFSIPVMINYSAIVFGQPNRLRENRFLIFTFHSENSTIKAEFKNSFLISRFGYPIKGHYFWYNPFNDNLKIQIEIQDQKDISELLNSQFENIEENLQIE